jgi:type IV pilus assembly protein PilM
MNRVSERIESRANMQTNQAIAVKTESAPFNPYHKWLGIRESQTPPNHYRLLGIELWETDEEVIREAYSRQANHVKSFATGPQRKLCEQILTELQAARDTLVEPNLRRPYDRWLKVIVSKGEPGNAAGAAPRQPFAVHSGGAPPASELSPREVQCAQCGVENASSRKFCAGCGVALWQPCIECGVVNGPGDLHCGSCGVNLAAAIQKQTEELERRLQQADEFRQQRDYDQAIQTLDALLSIDHPRLAEQRNLAEQTVFQLKSELAEWTKSAKTAEADAERLRQLGDFEQAALLLEQLPPQLATEAIKSKLSDIRDRQVEALTLAAEVQQAISENRFAGLSEKVSRWLDLQPQHPVAQKLQARLRHAESKNIESRRSKLYQIAVAETQRRNYSQATNLLEQIPTEHRTAEITSLLEKTSVYAAETDWLRSDLREAVIDDEHLLPIAERLLKLHPDDAVAKKAVAALRQQAGLTPEQRQKSKPSWPRFPAKSRWGFPIDVVHGFTQFDIDAKAGGVLSHPDDWCVALGLALQGLDKGVLNANLLPREKTGLLNRLKLRKRAATNAWGIDVGRNSIKAVRLSFPAEATRPVILDTASIPIAAGEVSTSATESVHAALNSFLDQKTFDDCAICVGISAQKTLMRFFELPRLDRKRVGDVMQYEARQQIPVPLETMVWDYHVAHAKPSSDAAATGSEDHVALFAVKLDDAQAQVKPFVDRKLTVDLLQTDCAALYNFLMFEHFPSNPAPQPTTARSDKVIAMLDVGADSSNIVVTNGARMFMRSISTAGNQFTRALSKQYNLDSKQGEKLKRNPTAAKWLHRLYEALEPNLQQLAIEVQKSIEQFTASAPQPTVEQMLVVGSGARLHGLLRYLNFGR